jgi:hypothetical protein
MEGTTKIRKDRFMKTSVFKMVLRLFVGVIIMVNLLFAQEKAPDTQAMMKKYMDASAPGNAHKKFDNLVGSWDIATTMWMNGSDKPPTTAKGTAELKWVLGGRFLQQETKGEFMGMPSAGIGFNGYDNLDKKYTMFWIDNSATAMYTAEGNFDKSGKVLTMYGKMDEVMTGEHDKYAIYVLRLVDKDKWIFEFYDATSQPSTKVGEMVYTRKK